MSIREFHAMIAHLRSPPVLVGAGSIPGLPIFGERPNARALMNIQTRWAGILYLSYSSDSER